MSPAPLQELAPALAGWLVAAVATAVAWRRHARLEGASRVIAEAAHELRGPLCAARLAVGALARSLTDTSELSPRLGAVDLELRRAGLAVEDLSAAMGAGLIPTGEETTDLRLLLATAAPAWQALAGQHATRLIVRVPAEPVRVRADGVRLAQALGNLVANACEHGGSSAWVEVFPGEDSVTVEVGDDGEGLPAPVARWLGSHRTGLRPCAGRRGHGLTVAARVAAGCGGRLESLPADVDRGDTRLRLTLARDGARRRSGAAGP